MKPKIHPTAIIEEGVQIGDNTSIWDNVHIRRNARIGQQCIIGDKTHIGYDVEIGNFVKIGSFVNICPGVKIEDGVMIAPGVIFTNEIFPRATTPDMQQLNPSEPTKHTLQTLVCQGTTIGANSTIRGGIRIGRWVMIGMGSIVIRSVPDFHLSLGAPAKSTGIVCRCGAPIIRFSDEKQPPDTPSLACPACGLCYAVYNVVVQELNPPG